MSQEPQQIQQQSASFQEQSNSSSQQIQEDLHNINTSSHPEQEQNSLENKESKPFWNFKWASAYKLKGSLQVTATGPQDTCDEISEEDINHLNSLKYQIALYPIGVYLGVTGLKKIVESFKFPELLRNPLLPPKVNVHRGQFFKNFMTKNITLLLSVTSIMGGFAILELNKYYMYLKYQNLVESYLDSCEREYLKTLSIQGKQIHLTLGALGKDQKGEEQQQ